MQVLCKISNTVSDVRCRICGQGFLVYWSGTSKAEQEATRRNVIDALAEHHTSSNMQHAHPGTGFNVPDWAGVAASLSVAALLDGAGPCSI
jgi:hypothetical protein